MDNQTTTQSQVEPQVTSMSQKPRKSKVVLYALLVLVIAAAAFAVAYFWQNSKNDSTVAKLNDTTAKVSALETQLAQNSKETDNSPSSVTTNPDLIPGGTDTRSDDGKILIAAIYKYSLEPTAVWVEYGTSPTDLSKSTSKITQELSLGDPGDVYAQGRSVSISDSDVKPGTTYYYRIAATVDGQTQRSAVASFVTDK